MARTICLFSQKGGVGKTTTVVNLAAALALSGQRTLLVDCDPQGSATLMSGLIPQRYALHLDDALSGKAKAEDLILQGCLHHLKIIPAPRETSLADRQRWNPAGNASLLKKALAGIALHFDYILIDTPASDWPFIMKGITAADFLLILLRADYLAFRFLGRGLDNIQMIRQQHNPGLKLAGIVLTMYDEADESSRLIFSNARKYLSRWLFRTVIPRDREIGASPLFGKPLVVCQNHHPAARRFLKLGHELREKTDRS